MSKKKMTNAERKAKARAYAKRVTINKMRDAVAVAGGGIDNLIRYGMGGGDGQLENAQRNYTGMNMYTGEVDTDYLYRGYTGALVNKAERVMYNALGIQRPADKKNGNYNLGDVLDYITYDGAAALHAWERRDNPREAFTVWYKTHYGYNLNEKGMGGIQLDRWLWEKQAPYVIQRKIRQLPFVKQQFAKLNKAFGGF